MAEYDLRKGIYLKYADLMEIPCLLGEKEGVRQQAGGLLIPRGVTEQDFLSLLQESGVGYDMPSRKSYRVCVKLFGLDMPFAINFWFEDGRQDSVDIESLEAPEWGNFRRVQKRLRAMLGSPLEKYMAGPLGGLGVFMLGGGAMAEWYEQGASIEHELGAFMSCMRHHIRIRYLD